MIAKAIASAGDGLIKIRSIEASKEVRPYVNQFSDSRLRKHFLGNKA